MLEQQLQISLSVLFPPPAPESFASLALMSCWLTWDGLTSDPEVLRSISVVTRQRCLAQLAIVMQMSRQESRSSAGPDHVADQVQIT